MHEKVAFITGSASGMGFAVAAVLSSHPTIDWNIHRIDSNEEAEKQASSKLKNASFHKTNATDYKPSISAFKAAWNTHQRLDFVFVNAGIIKCDNFYTKHNLDGPPPPPTSQLSVDVNYKAVVNTSCPALHCFPKSLVKHGREGSDPVLIMTSSQGAASTLRNSAWYILVVKPLS